MLFSSGAQSVKTHLFVDAYAKYTPEAQLNDRFLHSEDSYAMLPVVLSTDILTFERLPVRFHGNVLSEELRAGC